MSFLLDTNTCSAHLRDRANLFHRFTQHGGALAISTLNLAELYVWAYASRNTPKLLDLIRNLLRDVEVLSIDGECAHQFGILRSELIRLGVQTDPFDLMIASVAIVHNLTLVTHNVKDFENIPGLRWVDWLAD